MILLYDSIKHLNSIKYNIVIHYEIINETSNIDPINRRN